MTASNFENNEPASPRKTFAIMKVAAVVLMAGVLALLTYHSNLHEGLFAKKLSSSLLDLGPASGRPPAEDFEFKAEGEMAPRKLSSLRGHVVHLNFWATWCEPCLRELPALEALMQESPRQADGLPLYQVILVNLDSGEANVAKAKEMRKALAPSALAVFESTAQLAADFALEVLPMHMLYDKEMRVAVSFYAALDTRLDEFKRLLRRLSAEEAPVEPAR